ncbi:MAG: L,D-transpeptidase family protein [Pseudomonadota bacterium]|nr:L,D-transpeptidase family protein [Pseudomonadota bacterium]
MTGQWAARIAGQTENMMRVHGSKAVGLGVMAGLLASGAALAQRVDPIAPLPAPTASAQLPVPSEPPVVVAPEAAPVLPPAVWRPADVAQLGIYIRGVGRDGLNPVDYDPAGLDRAMRSGDPLALSAAATGRFNKLSSDLALGHVRGDARIDWHVVDKDLDATRQRQLLDQALATGQLATTLDGLLPTHPQYGALRYALEVTPRTETAKVNRIRLNMDRWRWLPRELGAKYIIVNVPAYHATLVENGATRWRQKAIAGAIKTPTPQLTAMATGVILNPWWEVPTSIAKEVAGKAGYIAVKGKDGKVQRWRQPPGPSNALGQMKFVMPNQYAIYLHDTNARSRFNSQVRALSHGCVRTEDIHDLAAELGSDDAGEWTRSKIDEVLASKKTVEAKFVKPLPVYIVYFSSAALTDGTIVNYDDIYKRDTKVIAALLDSGGKQAAPAGASAKKVTAR